jgi:hypothetical protein
VGGITENTRRIKGVDEGLRLAKVALGLAEADLDWVQFRAVGREIQEFQPGLSEDSGYLAALVDLGVVHNQYQVDSWVRVHARELPNKHQQKDLVTKDSKLQCLQLFTSKTV